MKWEKINILGVLHLPPLPGSPGFRAGTGLEAVLERAVSDARAWQKGGADGLMIENFGDLPFFAGSVLPETIAAMAVAAARVREAVDIPIGFNVLRNDARAAIGLAASCGAAFVRVNVHSGAMVTDQGVIEGKAAETIRARNQLCPDVEVLADVLVKHAAPLGTIDIRDCARDTLHRGMADALIISGSGTGQAIEMDDLRAVREACPAARIFVGSGATAETASSLLEYADGLIVGSSVKVDGVLENPVDCDAVARLVEAAHRSR